MQIILVCIYANKFCHIEGMYFFHPQNSVLPAFANLFLKVWLINLSAVWILLWINCYILLVPSFLVNQLNRIFDVFILYLYKSHGFTLNYIYIYPFNDFGAPTKMTKRFTWNCQKRYLHLTGSQARHIFSWHP